MNLSEQHVQNFEQFEELDETQLPSPPVETSPIYNLQTIAGLQGVFIENEQQEYYSNLQNSRKQGSRFI